MRSSPTEVAAIVLVILARSCTGLKNLDRYARKTVREPTVMAPVRIREAPRHRTMAVQRATVRFTTGDSSDLIWRAFRAASTVA